MPGVEDNTAYYNQHMCDWPLVCGNQLHHKDMGWKISLFQRDLRKTNASKVCVPKFWQLVTILFYLDLDDQMNEEVQ